MPGSPEEIDLTNAVALQMQKPVINLAGETSLGALAALISNARLVVSNDTGIAHIASAVRTPSLVLLSASDPKRWAPQDLTLHEVMTGAPEKTTEQVLSTAKDHLQEVYTGAF